MGFIIFSAKVKGNNGYQSGFEKAFPTQQFTFVAFSLSCTSQYPKPVHLRAHKMKTASYIFMLIAVITIAGCSEYGKVLKSTDGELKFQKAKEYFDSSECFKALPLFEELIGMTRGTARAEEVYYYYAHCNYCIKDYYLANYYFTTFTKTYPQSRFAEECLFMAAICSSQLSPNYSLDQQDTKNAINEFQLFLDRYPESTLRDSCNKLINKLNFKLEKKDFEVVKLYVRTERYKAGVNAIQQMLKEYPNSPYREEMMFLLVKSSFLYAQGSIPEKQSERYRATMDNYSIFAAAFPASKWLDEAEDYYNRGRKQVEKFAETDTP